MTVTETIAFESSSPGSFRELLTAEAALPRIEVKGFLSLPEADAGRVPLVITSIGSLGLASGREELYAKALTETGIAMLVVDSFGARGVSETTQDQGRVSFAASCADALHALRYAAGDARFNPSRIGLFGYSRGGCATLLCNDVRLHQAGAGAAPRFAAYVAYYPSVWLRWEHPRPTDAPCFIAIAGADDLAPPQLVQVRADALRSAGASITTQVIPGAFHSFDSLSPAAWKPGETNMSDADVVIADDGAMTERASGVTFERDWPDFMKRLREAGGKSGGTSGYGPNPRDVAIPPLLKFLSTTIAM